MVSHGQSDAHVDVQPARLQNELCGRGDVPVPVRLLVGVRPQQDVKFLRLELPEEIEEVEGRHGVNSWKRVRKRRFRRRKARA